MNRAYDDNAERIFRMLTEYCSVIEEYNYSYDENAIFEMEYIISEVIADSFPSVLPFFQEICSGVHKLIEYGEILNPLGFEDDFICLYNMILRQREIKSWSKTMHDNDYFYKLETFIYSSVSIDQFCYFDDESDVLHKEESQKKLEFKKAVQETLQYLRNSKKPVQRATLMAEIKNCSSNVISHACVHHDILNYFGSYFCGTNISIDQLIKDRLKKHISNILNDREIHHADELYQKLKDIEHIVLSDSYVHSSFQLLSLIQYLFENEYTISRPFIALKSIHIPTIPERVIRFFEGRKEILISDINEFFHEKKIIIPSLLSLFDAVSKFFLIRDHTTLIAANVLGLTPAVLKQIEECIMNELEEVGYKAIRELLCFPVLPRISVPWTEWLLYSVIRKDIPTIYAYTTSPQFRHGIPVLSLHENLDAEELSEISERHQGAIRTTAVVDFNDLDEEINDDILLEFDWEENDEL